MEETEATQSELSITDRLRQLNSPSLETRLDALDYVTRQVQQHSEIKIIPTKKIIKVVLELIIDDYYREKSWKNRLILVFQQVLALGIPHAAGTIHDYLIENKAKYQHTKGKNDIIALILMVLSSSQATSAAEANIDVYKGLLLLMYDLVISMSDVDVVKNSNKWQDNKEVTVSRNKSQDKSIKLIHHHLMSNAFVFNLFASSINDVSQISIATIQKCNIANNTAILPILVGALVLPEFRDIQLPKNVTASTIETLRTVVMNIYIARFLDSRQALTSSWLNCFSTFISSITTEEWTRPTAAVDASSNDATASLMDKVLGTMKKAPEGSAAVTSHFFMWCSRSLDMTTLVLDGAAASSIKALRSSSLDSRVAAVSTYNNLVMHSLASNECSVALLRVLCDVLLGKNGQAALTQVNQKFAFYTIIDNFVSQARLSTEARGILHSEFVPQLLNVTLDKETDQGLRMLLAHILGVHLSFNTSSIAQYVEVVKKSMKKMTTLRTVLMSILIALHELSDREGAPQYEEVVNGVMGIQDELVTVVKDTPKVFGEVEGLIALRLLVEVASTSSATLSALQTNKLLNSVTTTSSFLYSKALVTAIIPSNNINNYQNTSEITIGYGLSVNEEIRLAQKSEYLASFYLMNAYVRLLHLVTAHGMAALPAVVPSSYSTPDGVLDTDLQFYNPVHSYLSCLLCLLTCKNVELRTSMCTAVAGFTGRTGVTPNLLYLLLSVLNNVAYKQQEIRTAAPVKSTIVVGDELVEDAKTKTYQTVSPTTLIQVLRSLFKTLDRVVTADDLTMMVHLCSHPLITTSTSLMLTVWYELTSDLTSLPEIAQLLPKVLQYVVRSSMESVRISSANAILLLFQSYAHTNENTVISALVAEVAQILAEHSPFLLALTDVEVAYYLDPCKAISTELSKLVTVKDSDIKITNADRKKDAPRAARRGNFGSDFVEDEEWQEKVKQEKLKKISDQKQEEYNAEYAKRLAAATSKNKDLAVHVERIQGVFTMLNNLPLSLVADLAPVLIPKVFTIMRCKLVESQVFQFILLVVNSVDNTEIDYYSRDIANAFRLASLQELVITSEKNREIIEKERMNNVMALAGPYIRMIKGIQPLIMRQRDSASDSSVLLDNIALVYVLTYILHHLLTLPQLVPGCEASWMLLEAIWAKSYITLFNTNNHKKKENLVLLRPLQGLILESCLCVLNKFNRLEPAVDKVLFSFAVGNLSEGEWDILLSIDGLFNTDSTIRLVILKVIASLIYTSVGAVDIPQKLIVSLWTRLHDDSEAVRALSQEIIAKISPTHPLPADYYVWIEPFFNHPIACIRTSAAYVIGEGLRCYNENYESTSAIIKRITALYQSLLPVKEAGDEPKQKGKEVAGGKVTIKLKPVTVEVVDTTAQARISIATSLLSLGATSALNSLDKSSIQRAACDLLDFILMHGVVDTHTDVRTMMMQAGRTIIDVYGKDSSSIMLSNIETLLSVKVASNASKDDLAVFDRRHEAAVVLLGAVGKHLDKDDPKLINITRMMMDALKIPSELVQKAVAESLVSLVQVIKGHDSAKDMLEELIQQSLNSESYGERRGAAYGISAFIKGMGIASLKQYDIVNRLKEACSNGSVNSRQGSLFVFECLSDRMGLLFEPYVITIIPALLKSFSHSSDHVRESAQLAAKVIMTKLSAHGVKQVLTPILTSLPDETQWKTRQESIRLLGTMAYCAPKQLASCLPQVVPRLVEAGSDPHPKVKESAKSALSDISSVIKNPEINRLAPTLLGALADPAKKIKDALEALLECEFMHSIDTASLAILVPLLARALKDRGADLKRKASAITGNMMVMVSDPKSLVPYLNQLLPGLQSCLIDPIPDVRATSAKALGSLIGVGEEEKELVELVPWLVNTLQVDSSPVERSGAAQGLSEVCLTLGSQRLQQILSQLMSLSTDARAASREGLLWVLSFLPPVLKQQFASHISKTLPVILTGLSDSNEGVREVAMRAGQIYVSVLGQSNTLQLVPSLSDGMFNADWRIRHSSVLLLGELLYLVGDTKAAGLSTAEAGGDDEDVFGYSSSISRVSVTIKAHMGEKVANTVFASLYIARSDISNVVRQAASQVWKSIIANSPKTLVEIMPLLVTLLIDKLSSYESDLRIVGGRALGEVVKKLGDKVLPVIIPHLHKGLNDSNISINTRQGVCLGLTEILGTATKDQIDTYLYVLVPAIQQALCDPSADVRSYAAKAFGTLYKTIQNRAIDEVVPSLLDRLSPVDSDEDDFVLAGLCGVVLSKPRDMLEYLLPKLFTQPISSQSLRAIGAIAAATSQYLYHHFHFLIPSLVLELCNSSDAIAAASADGTSDELITRFEVLKGAATKVVGSLTTVGVHYLTTELGKQIEHDNDNRRRIWGAWITEMCFTCIKTSNSSVDFTEYIAVVLKFLLTRVAAQDTRLLEAVSQALMAISTAVPLDELIKHIEFMRSCIASTASDARHRGDRTDTLVDPVTGEFTLPLFTVSKAVEPLLNIFIHGLMNGSPLLREQSADGIGELASMCPLNNLKPYLIKTTGPLIRVVGDRFPSDVKSAILNTLTVLLDKGNVALKAFAPQLQTTFVKSLNDSSKTVRTKAADALGKLMPLVTRVDPLVTELSQSIVTSESNAIKSSIFEGLGNVLSKGSDKVTMASLDKCKVIILQGIIDDDENVRKPASFALCGYSLCIDSTIINDMLAEIVTAHRAADKSEGVHKVCGRYIGLGALLQGAGSRASDSKREEAYGFIRSGFYDERAVVKLTCTQAICTLLTLPQGNPAAIADRKGEYKTCAQFTIHAFAKELGLAAAYDDNTDIKYAGMLAIKTASKLYRGAAQKYLHYFVDPLLNGIKDINLRIIGISQRALKYLLLVPEGKDSSILNEYLNGLQMDTRNFIKDYSKRTLAKMAADSDEE